MEYRVFRSLNSLRFAERMKAGHRSKWVNPTLSARLSTRPSGLEEELSIHSFRSLSQIQNNSINSFPNLSINKNILMLIKTAKLTYFKLSIFDTNLNRFKLYFPLYWPSTLYQNRPGLMTLSSHKFQLKSFRHSINNHDFISVCLLSESLKQSYFISYVPNESIDIILEYNQQQQ
jgi:hypothetical protein